MKRLRESTDNPISKTSTNANAQRFEIHGAGPPRAGDLFETDLYPEIKCYLIDRIIESNDDDAYPTLLNLKRVNKWWKNEVDACFSKKIQDLYNGIYPFFGFKDLEPYGFSIASPCLKAFQIKQQVNGLDENGPTFQIRMADNTYRFYTFDYISQFRKTLILYFEAKRNPETIACKTFIESFEAHLSSFKSLCQDNNFQFYPIDGHYVRFTRSFNWLMIPFLGMDLSLSLFVNPYSPCSAYIFAHFLNAYVLSSKIVQLIKLSYHEGMPQNTTFLILTFFEYYRDFDLVSNTIKHFIGIIGCCLANNDIQIVANSLKYFDEFIQRGLIDKSFAEKTVFPAATKLLSHNNFHIQENALSLVNSLLKKEYFEKTFIENPLFQEQLERLLFIHSGIKGQGFAALNLLFLKNHSGDSLSSKLNLIEKIVEAQPHLPGDLFQQLVSYTSIEDSLKSAMNECITKIISSDKFDDIFYAYHGILYQLAEQGLIEKSCLQLVINKKLNDWLCSDVNNFKKGCNFFENFTQFGFFEESWILESNLIQKLLHAQNNLGTECEPMLSLLRIWIPQFPGIIQCFLAQILEFFYSENNSYVIGEQLWMLCSLMTYDEEDDAVINPDLLREFKLVEQLASGIASYPKQKLDDANGRVLAEASLIRLFLILTQQDLLTQSMLHEFQIIEELFSQIKFNLRDDKLDDSPNYYIKKFFDTLIKKSLITKENLIILALSFLSLNDIPDRQKLRIQSNVITFLEFSLPIDKELVKEHQLINKLTEMFSLFDRKSKEGKKLYHLFSELIKLK
ncbi:MAG: hypothetical protein C5B43_02390 [Verrucomicrobia bacterium]|nr:MAG: hypothetical protein C5B43_02390 [Verrucomicrobiota bacterium]